MKLIYKEEPKEWRKSALLTALGVAILSSILRWRRILPVDPWLALLVVMALVALCSILRPRWFRGWYRLSLRLGFYSSQFIGRCVLVAVFLFMITPMGWIMRLLGKDPLQLRRPSKAASCWHPAKSCSPLDRMF
jgi:hypothetical protein